MTSLSEHFTLEEFTYSDTANAKGIPNKPSSTQKKVMEHTCVYLLEPLRKLLNEHYGTTVRIIITSGFRSLALNKAVGGAASSEHLLGQAVDIRAEKNINGKWVLVPYTELYDMIKYWVRNGDISVNQCILEKSGQTTWVHISHSSAGRTRDKREFLTYKNGSYVLDCRI